MSLHVHMNIKERLRDLRRSLARSEPISARRQVAKVQQLEFSLPLIQRSRALRLSPSASR